jgi:hypothetical protein
MAEMVLVTEWTLICTQILAYALTDYIGHALSTLQIWKLLLITLLPTQAAFAAHSIDAPLLQ